MIIDKAKVIEEFNRIKSKGFIKSNRVHNTGIGKTFEDHLGVMENNVKEPDFMGFEVKSQRARTSSFLTLFTKSPSLPKKANTYLRDKYGEFYVEYPELKHIHTSMFANKFNTYKNVYKFKISNNPEEQSLLIQVAKINSTKIIDQSVGWLYKDIENCITKKIKALFYVTADVKVKDGIEYFHYTKAEIYMNPSMDNFLNILNEGKVMVDIRIGSYKTGRNIGKTHDHGTAFRIQSKDLPMLYNDFAKID